MNVGVDIGFGNVKLYDDRGKTIIASHLGEPRVSIGNEGGADDTSTFAVSFDGIEYLVGEQVATTGRELPSLGQHRLTGGHESKAIFFAAITKRYIDFGRYKDPIDVYIGVPAELLIGTEEEAKKNIEMIQAWMLNEQREHRWKYKGKEHSVKVNSVTVRTQANGALGDMIHNLNGQQTKDVEFVQRGLGIISVGFNTVELSGALFGRPAKSMTASELKGVRTLLEKHRSKRAIANLDYEYRNGLLPPEIHKPLVAQWASGIISSIETRWGSNIHEIKRIFLVGGGAKDAFPALQSRFGDIIVMPDDPYISIARGLYKWAVRNGRSVNN